VRAKTLMIQGTSSSVGKSVLSTALCRIFRQEGLRVAPFKAQNMALNSFVTKDGGEIGRAQAVQAEAAGIDPTVDMNPILIKPEADARAQIIVLGHPLDTLSAQDYYSRKASLWSVARGSLERLMSNYDLIVIEGAGSPVEVNLKDGDIVNMRVAKLVSSPVFLVGDVDKGGVFASLVGTMELLEPDERDLVKGFVINKFRGELSLLKPGLSFLEEKTGIRVVGVVPYFRDIFVAQEDSVYLEHRKDTEKDGFNLDIAVLKLPHISNFDDFDPLEQEPGVRVRYVERCDDMGQPDLIIVPGSKSTMADLLFLRKVGLAQRVVDLARSGTPVIGICGGYQMLGREIKDPERVESSSDWMEGLGLLDISTTFERTKTTRQVRCSVAADRGLFENSRGLGLVGYEIHMGITNVGCIPPAFVVESRRTGERHHDGAVSEDGTVFGSYLHGLFDTAEFRRNLLANLLKRKGLDFEKSPVVVSREQNYNRLADLVRRSLDMDYLWEVVRG